jgi:hypothetical protein
MKWFRARREIKNERSKTAPERKMKTLQRKPEKDVIKTETQFPSIIEFNSDAPCKLNNEMNCQEGAIAMTTTATTANKPNAYFSFSEVPVVLNANQLASVLNISLTNAYCLLRSENFPTLRIGRRLLVSRDNLLNWMNEHSLAS